LIVIRARANAPKLFALSHYFQQKSQAERVIPRYARNDTLGLGFVLNTAFYLTLLMRLTCIRASLGLPNDEMTINDGK